jgi:hypothetical protein
MADNLSFHDLFGVSEYYVYDPPLNTLDVWLRQDGRLRRMSHLGGWTSPRLGIRFALGGETLEIFDPQGRPFLSSVELAERLKRESARAAHEAVRGDREHQRAEREREGTERLAERLRALGIEP